jgi:hypothetical protein
MGRHSAVGRAAAAVVVAVAAAIGSGGAVVGAANPGAHPDFDDDGFADVVVPAPFDNLSTPIAGTVQVLYGSGAGIGPERDRIFRRSGLPAPAGIGSFGFGMALAWGDFDGDGYDDVAVGSSSTVDAGGPQLSAGTVDVLYGGPNGLVTSGAQSFTQAAFGEVPEEGDRFGSALAAGDFNGDGRADLAVGAHGEDDARGWVSVLYGASSGLTTAGAQQLRRGAGGVNGTAETNDRFGYSLAAGDFDGDGRDDLAVGVPADVVAGLNAGSIHVLYGAGTGGLGTSDDRIFHRGVSGVAGDLAENAGFGRALAAADFNGNGRDDLAIGAPLDPLGGTARGSATVLYGRLDRGLRPRGSQLWSRATEGVRGAPDDFDYFALLLAAGDFNRDGRDDLAIAVPFDDVAGYAAAGAVNVLYGSRGPGLTADGDQLWHRNRTGVRGSVAAGDIFGANLLVGDYDGNGRDDLVVGVPGQDVAGIVNAGAVHVLYGRGTRGLGATGDAIWHRASAGIAGDLGAHDSWSIDPRAD